MFDVRAIGVTAIVLAPGECAVEQVDVDGRHLFGHVVVASAEVACSQQSEDRLSGDRGHEAALMIQPVSIAAFRDAVADEGQARAHRASVMCESTGRSSAVLRPNDDSSAEYFR